MTLNHNSNTDSTGETRPGADLPATERAIMGGVGAVLIGGALRGSPLRKLVLGTVGAGLAYMSATGRNPLATALKIEQTPEGETVIRDAVTINKPAGELYDVWRDLPNLPRLMTHLKSVEVLNATNSRWTVKAPAGQEVTWEAQLLESEPGKRLAWESLPGSVIENSGEVLFNPAPGQRGTEVTVRLKYRPPGGTAGAVVARLLGEEPAQQLRDDLMRFKREQELGFAPTTQGQSSGRMEDRK